MNTTQPTFFWQLAIIMEWCDLVGFEASARPASDVRLCLNDRHDLDAWIGALLTYKFRLDSVRMGIRVVEWLRKGKIIQRVPRKTRDKLASGRMPTLWFDRLVPDCKNNWSLVELVIADIVDSEDEHFRVSAPEVDPENLVSDPTSGDRPGPQRLHGGTGVETGVAGGSIVEPSPSASAKREIEDGEAGGPDTFDQNAFNKSFHKEHKGKDPWAFDWDNPEFHASHIEMVLKCGCQFELRQKLGPRPPGIAAAVGSSTHTVVDLDMTHKMNTGELLEDEQIEDEAAEAFERKWGYGVALSKEERAEDPKQLAGRMKDRTVKLARLHHDELAPYIFPVSVEEAFTLRFADVKWGLAGRRDIVEPELLRDTKTAGMSPNQSEADDSLQLTMYSLKTAVDDRISEVSCLLDKLVCTKKTGKTYHKSLPTVRNKDHFRQLVGLPGRRDKSLIGRVWSYVKAGNFAPAPRGAWWCSEQWCGYWFDCDFGCVGRVKP